MAAAADLLREREFRGIRIALIARLIIIIIALPVDQTLAAASRTGQINSLIGLSAGFVVVAPLLMVLQFSRRVVLVGLAAVIVDIGLMLGLLVGWWDTIGGAAIPTGLMFKTAMGGVMAVFIALNALTLRPLYPLLTTLGMALIYIGLGVIAVGDPQTNWTNDYLTAFVGPAVSLPQIAAEFMVLLFVGALVV